VTAFLDVCEHSDPRALRVSDNACTFCMSLGFPLPGETLAYIVAHNPPALADPFLARLSGMMRKWNLLGRRNGQRL
jgi:hypothetical protein